MAQMLLDQSPDRATGGEGGSGLARLTCNDANDKHTHVGAERAGPEQPHGAVGLPGRTDRENHGD